MATTIERTKLPDGRVIDIDRYDSTGEYQLWISRPDRIGIAALSRHKRLIDAQEAVRHLTRPTPVKPLRSTDLDTDDFDKVADVLRNAAEAYRNKAETENDSTEPRGALWDQLADVLESAGSKCDRINDSFV